MPLKPFDKGRLQFTLNVNAKGKVNPESLDRSESVFIDLDLNPNATLFEADDDTFNGAQLADVFEFMSNLVRYLDPEKPKGKKDMAKAQAANDFINKYYNGKVPPLKQIHSKRIVRVILNKNSPATANIYYAASYNGDLKPPGGRP